MEATFKHKNQEFTESDKELEDEICQEAENCAAQILINKEKYDSLKISNENVPAKHYVEESNIKQEVQAPIFCEPPLEISNMNESDQDSTLGLSIQDSTHKVSSPDLVINIPNTEASLGSSKPWIFIPLSGSVPLLLGHVKNGETGDMFAIYSDGDAALDHVENKDDIPWCSVYLLVRLLGLSVVAACLGGLILQHRFRGIYDILSIRV